MQAIIIAVKAIGVISAIGGIYFFSVGKYKRSTYAWVIAAVAFAIDGQI